MNVKTMIAAALLGGSIYGAPAAQARISCLPNHPTNNIFSKPDEAARHPDWINGVVGTSWSFDRVRDAGRYLRGDLISSRGGRWTKNAFVLKSEWSCANYP